MRIEKPERIGWEITRFCNLTCPHCYSAATKKPLRELSTAESLNIIKSLKEMGTGFIGWTGGEPLLRGDLEKLISYAAEMGIKSAITSNGVLLDEKRARSLQKAGVRMVQISIDGSTPEWNNRIRRATTEEFYKALEAVRICRRLGYSVTMAMLIGEENLDDAPEYIKLATHEGVDCVRFCGFVPFGRGKSQNHRLGFTERKGDLKKFVSKHYGSEKPMIAFDPAFGPPPPYYYFHECMAGKSMFYLTCTGDVFPCTSLLGKENLIGNVRKRSLADIWNDPKMTAVSDLRPQDIHGVCRDCRHLKHCHGACRGITKCHTGDLYASFPLCLYRVKNKSKAVKHPK
ncbi:MAG: radical SAM protein [candidate division Zixibacteria bacterium]|nr:radical SAM protein [candidate division Zixibacteria bacterium]